MKAKWTTKFPKKVGNYWFYGYRYGKVSCGTENKPELMFVEVHKCSTGLLYEAKGQFMFEEEVEEALYTSNVDDVDNLALINVFSFLQELSAITIRKLVKEVRQLKAAIIEWWRE